MFLKVYKFRLLMALLLIPFVMSADPPDWDKTETPFTNFLTVPVGVTPMLNGVAIETGDWIGVFFNDAGTLVCGGSVEYVAGLANGFSAFGDDFTSPGKDGFADGESFLWAIYDVSTTATVYGEADPPGAFVFPFASYTLAALSAPGGLVVAASATPDLFCPGDPLPYEAVLTATDISGTSISWEWFDNGNSVGIGNPLTVTVTETTNFRLEASDGTSPTPLVAEAFVTVTVNTVDAGPDEMICITDGSFTLAGAVVSDYLTIEWTTSGADGSFVDPGVVNAVYNPAATDGDVTLTLTVVTFDCGQVVDDMELTFAPEATVDLLDDSYYVCKPDTLFMDATKVVAENFKKIQWTIINGTAEWHKDSTLYPYYVPTPADYTYSGCVQILVTVESESPCSGVADDMAWMVFVTPPTADAGVVDSICLADATSFTFDAAVTFTPSINPGQCGDFTNEILWETTNGEGTFDFTDIANPTYTLGGSDTLGGKIDFTLTATTLEACAPAVDTTSIFVQLAPEIDIIPETYTICENDSMDFAGKVTASNYSSLQWFSTNGGTLQGGSFNNEKIPEPIYTPSSYDILQGCIEIYVTAFAEDPCTTFDDDEMLLCFAKLPTIAAMPDDTVCANEVFTTAPVVENDTVPYLWTVDPIGGGTFVDDGVLFADFIPDLAYVDSTVVLTLSVGAIGPCDTGTSASMNLFIACPPYVNAGPDQLICETDSATLVCTADCVEFVMWATTGDGQFICPNCIQGGTIYIPGPQDLIDGCVTLVLVGYPEDPCTMWEVDKMELCFSPAPYVEAGPPQTICEDGVANVSGIATDVASHIWVAPFGSGSFDNDTLLNTFYTPGLTDVVDSVALVLLGSPISPCTVEASDTLWLTTQRRPQVFAGSADSTFCADTTYTLSEATAAYYESLLWTTSGDGTFSDSLALNPVYTPGDDDIDLGYAELFLTAYAETPCAGVEKDSVVINIMCLPEIDIVPDTDTICYWQDYDFAGKVVGDCYSKLQWFTINGGDDWNGNDTILEPIFTPDALSDYSQGHTEIVVAASPNSPCLVSADDMMILYYQEPVEVEPMPNDTICEDDTFIPMPVIYNGGDVVWTTSGDGSFSDSTVLNPIYTHGPNDRDLGYAELCIEVSGLSTCEPVEACMELYITWKPEAFAGPNDTVCEQLCASPWTLGEVYLTADTVKYNCGQYWTSSGNGVFTDANALHPMYTLSEADTAAGFAVLYLHALACAPCTDEVVDSMIVTIQFFPEANAGPNQTVCEDDPVLLDGSTTNAFGVFWDFAYLGEGDGTFSSQVIDDPIYYPGPVDIDSGYVELIFVAFPFDPCSYPAADVMTIFITPKPTSIAGLDATICAGDDYPLSGSVTNATGILWTTDGDGTFTPDSITLAATYIPGIEDKSIILNPDGEVVIGLWAFDGSACDDDYVSYLTLTILQPPIVDPGPDASICFEENYTTSPTITYNDTYTVAWTHNGNGSFDNPALENATYTPGTGDAGTDITIIIIVTPDQCSTPVVDSLILTIYPEPALGFCFDGKLAGTGDTFDYCFDQEVNVSLCEVWAGTGPFDICYSLDGATPVCKMDVVLDSVFSLGVLSVGTPHSVQITSITDANGCTSLDTQPYLAYVEVHPEPTVAITLDGDPTPVLPLNKEYCWNDDFQICMEGEDGTGPWTAEWAVTGPSGPFGDIMTGTQECWDFNAADFLPGEYDLTVVSLTDSLGCAASAASLSSYSFQIVILPEPTLVITLDGDPIPVLPLNKEYCWNDDFQICMEGEDGTGPWTVEWEVTGQMSFGDVMTGTSECWDFNAADFEPGIYNLTVVSLMDDKDCSASQIELDSYAFQIEILPEPFITFGLNTEQVVPGFYKEFCYDELITFTMFDYWAGTPPFEVQFKVLKDGIDYLEEFVTVTNDGDLVWEETPGAGTYDISVLSLKDANGCFASQATLDLYTGQIVVRDEPFVGFCFGPQLAGTGDTFEYCYNEEIDVTLCEVWGGTGPFTINYTIDGVAQAEVVVDQGDHLITPATMAPETYVIQVTSIVDFYGCEASDVAPYNATVIVYEEPFVGFCFNTELAGTGDIFDYCYNEEIDVTLCEVWGGDGPFTIVYAIDGVDQPEVVVAQGESLIPAATMAPGNYIITITSIVDIHGCASSDVYPYMAYVNVHPEPAIGLCFDGDLAVTGSVFEYCFDQEVNVSLCEVWAGTGPFEICYQVNAGPIVCESDVRLNDVFTLDANSLPVGPNTIQITSITDSLGCVADVAPYLAYVEVFPEPTITVKFNDVVDPVGTQELCWNEDFEICMTGVVGVPNWEVEWEVTGPMTFGETTIITTTEQCWGYNASIFTPGTYTLSVLSLTDGMDCAASSLGGYSFQIEIMVEPSLGFCFNGDDVTSGQVLDYCETDTVIIDLCHVNAGTAPFEVCYDITFDGAPLVTGECQDLELNDQLWNDLVDPGQYVVTVTSITDADDCEVSDPGLYNVTVNIIPGPIATVVPDFVLCDNVTSVPLEGVCENSSSCTWTHDGQGFIDNADTCVTFYTPYGDDFDNGVTFTLTCYPIDPPCSTPDQASVTVTFDPSPTAYAGLPVTICEGETYCLTADSATNYSALEWNDYLANGAPAGGTFVPDNDIHPCYTPASGVSGEIYLVLTAQPDGGCDTPAEGEMILTIVPKPTVDLGADRVLGCDDYDFTNAQWLPIDVTPDIEHAGLTPVVQWHSTGTGSFDNATAVNAVYHMSSDDIWGGEFALWIEVDGLGSCSFQAIDSIFLTVPQQIILIENDGWRGISSYLDPTLDEVPEIMQPVVLIPGSQHLIIMIDEFGDYYWAEPSTPVNKLADWGQIGYKAKFKNAPACLPIYGDTLMDQQFVVDFSDPQHQFDYLPVLTNVPVALDDLFAGLTIDDIYYIIDWDLNLWWTPGPAVTPLEEILPGKAYLVIAGVNPQSSYTVEFPDYNPDVTFIAAATAGDAVITSPWNDVVNTSQLHIIDFAESARGKFVAGDIIGVFNQNDECVGITEFADRESLIKLMAMGDDAITDVVDGFQVGELMNYKLYRQATDETFELTVTYDAEYPSYNGLFTINGVSSVVDFTMNLTGINDIPSNYSVSVYPNPANSVVNIASDYDMKNVTLVNYVGQTIYTAPVTGNSYQINVSNYVTGMYFVRIETTDGSVITKRVTIE